MSSTGSHTGLESFLGFEDVVGDGKNLALQDIRFARTINRIQKSMLAELNKLVFEYFSIGKRIGIYKLRFQIINDIS